MCVYVCVGVCACVFVLKMTTPDFSRLEFVAKMLNFSTLFLYAYKVEVVHKKFD